MLAQSDFEQKIVEQLNDPDMIERYRAQDPVLLQQIRSMAGYFALLAAEIDVASIEPFIRTRDRSIIADATNKGILPLATPCQHEIEITNNGATTVSLADGRMIEDNSGGRMWRLLQAVSIAPDQTVTATVEQSQYREISYTVPRTEIFHRMQIELSDDMNLSDIRVYRGGHWQAVPRWQNVAAGEAAYNLTTDSLRRLFVEFGDDARAGQTARQGDAYTIGLFETYGYVDVSRLNDAALMDSYSSDEQRLIVRFKRGGVVQAGSDPLSVAQLRVLSAYPSLYDENAVFLGNFDFLVRKKFMGRTDFISVWNETIHERYYGADWRNINHLHVAVTAKNPLEQAAIQNGIALLIGRADSLYQGRVIFDAVAEKPFNVTITGRLAAVHDIDSVKSQIRGLLVARYGRSSLAASRWLANGFNTQEIATVIRSNIAAFQDRVSDFSIQVDSSQIKPHEWVYITDGSVMINLERTADSAGTSWIL